MKKLANFKFTLDGAIITPEIVRYEEPKAGPKVSSYQVTRSVTSSTDILVALASHIVKTDKLLPSFQVYELLCGEIPVRSLIIRFAAPPPRLGRKVNLLNRAATHLTNSKCILCKAVDHILWDCPSPPAQVSRGSSLGPPLFEFKESQTWDPKLVEGLEDLQLQRRDQAASRGEKAYDSNSDGDTELADATPEPQLDSAQSAKPLENEGEPPLTRRKRRSSTASKRSRGRAATVSSSNESSESSVSYCRVYRCTNCCMGDPG